MEAQKALNERNKIMENVRLNQRSVYAENERIFLCLSYLYDDEKGTHEFLMPKIDLGLSQTSFSLIEKPYREPGAGAYLLQDNGCNFLLLPKYVPVDGVNRAVSYVDKIIKPAVHEMTLEEIEKELGYSVKIVNKKGEYYGQ